MAAEMKAIDRAAKSLANLHKVSDRQPCSEYRFKGSNGDEKARNWLLCNLQRALGDNRRMTAEQAAALQRLAKAAYELDAFKPNLTRAEADLRIAALAAKLKLLDGPPHTL
jgi:hypothetical protein